MTYDCAYCDHPANDHATGLCLSILECLCPGFLENTPPREELLPPMTIQGDEEYE